MAISLGGLNSGLDTNTLIQQLMQIEQRKLLKLQNRQQDRNDKLDALKELNNLLSDFKKSAKAISNTTELKSFKVKSSDEDIISATASDSAFEGTHSIKVNQLAASERKVYNTEYSYPDEKIGAGTFIYSYNNQQRVITTTDTSTLQSLVDSINNDNENPGVSASLLKYNNKYHLVLTGTNTGADFNISINPFSTHELSSLEKLKTNGAEAGLTTKIKDLDSFSGTLGTTDKITFTGTKHDGTPVSAELTISDTTTVERLLSAITDAFGSDANGATAILENGRIKLVDNTSGASLTTLTLGFTADPAGSAVLTLPGFEITDDGTTAATLAGFSNTADWTTTQSAQDSQIRVDGYPAAGWLENSTNSIENVIDGVTLDLNSVTNADETITLTITRDTETLKEKLQEFVTDYNKIIDFIKTNTKYDPATKTAGILISDFTVSAIRTKINSPLISTTSGFSKDTDTYTMPAQIGLTVDSESKLKLDTAVLDDALSSNYSDVLQLIGASEIGSSDSKDIKFYSASDNTRGGTYEIEATFNDSVLSSARTRLLGSTDWHTATVAGNVILASSQTDDSGKTLYPEAGLGLTAQYTGTATIAAQIRVKEGFAGTFQNVLDDFLRTKYGSLTIEQKNTSDSIENIGDQITKEQARLTRTEERLKQKFARLEKTMALLQSQRGALGM